MAEGRNKMVASDSETVPAGHVVGKVYLIEYDEALWFRMDETRRGFCIDYWRKIAEPLTDVEHLVLRLIPDPLFPLNGNEFPYIRWQAPIARKPACGFTARVVARYVLDPNENIANPRVNGALRSARASLPKGTRWRVIQNNKIIDLGIV